jgi:hypothetical protein
MPDETYAPTYEQAYWAPQPPQVPPPWVPPPPSRRLSRWVIVLIACTTVVVVVFLVASAAVPAFRAQRAKAMAAQTRVDLPGAIGGLTGTEMTLDMESQARSLRHSATAGMHDTQVGLFTDSFDSHRLLVVAGELSTDLDDGKKAELVRGFWRGVTQSLDGQTTVGTPAERPEAYLGGTVSCASYEPGDSPTAFAEVLSGEICIAVNPGSMVVTIDLVRLGGTANPDMITYVLAQVVHRGPERP